MSNGYSILPPVYDRWQRTYGKDFSSLILPRFLSSLRLHRVPKSPMLDLACGTGTLALMMARRGWEVWGIDSRVRYLREQAAGHELERFEVGAGHEASTALRHFRTYRNS